MTKTYDAYCARCDATVSVTLDPGAERPLDGATLECTDRCPSCADVVCPIKDATAEQLRERLEFLPHPVRGTGSEPGWDEDAEEVIRQGRIAAMRRGEDPVP